MTSAGEALQSGDEDRGDGSKVGVSKALHDVPRIGSEEYVPPLSPARRIQGARAPLLHLWRKVQEYSDLSEYEAKVYVAMNFKSSLTARELALLSGVPRTKVYVALKGLAERGLVMEVPGNPRRFIPEAPMEAFKADIQSYEERLKDFHTTIAHLERLYSEAMKRDPPEAANIWIVRGRREIVRRIEGMLSRARSSS